MPDPTPTFQLTWGWLVVVYLFIAGVGAGAYLTSWWARLRGLDERVARMGRYLAAPLVVFGTALLFFDLGAGLHNPLRVIWLFAHPTSIMTLGTWILVIFVILSIIETYVPLVLRKFRNIEVKIPAWVGVVTAVFAVFVMVYTGLLLGVVGAVPFWNSAVLPVLFAASAISTGMAATLGAVILTSRSSEGMERFGGAHIAFLGIEAALMGLFLFFAATSQDNPARFSFAAVIGGDFAVAFWLGFLIIGLVIPLVYNLAARQEKLGKALHSPVMVLVECACVLIGGYLLRYLVVAAGSFGHVFVSVG